MRTTKANSISLDSSVQERYDADERILWLRPLVASRAIQQRVASNMARTTEPILKEFFTASEVMEYLKCAHAHRFQFVDELTSTSLRIPGGKPSPAEEGNAFHDFMQWRACSHPGSTAAAEYRLASTAMERAAPRARVDDIERAALQIQQAAAAFDRSRWGREIANAQEAKREMPFVIQTGARAGFAGKVDLMYRQGDRWTLLDYKTSRTVLCRDVRVALADMALEYESQAAIYSIAAADTMGAAPRAFVLYSTDLQASCAIEPTWSWLMSWRAILGSAIDQLRADVRDPDRLGPAMYEATTCDRCPVKRVCKPEHLPSEA